MVNIRLVNSAKHGEALERLQRRTLPHDEPALVSNGWWWLAFDGDEPVAFAGLHRSVRWGDTGYLCRAGVLPSHRGQCLQRRLIAARERHARRLGMRWLISDTAGFNVRSANSLIGCGFRLYRPTKPWGVDDALYWRKLVCPPPQ